MTFRPPVIVPRWEVDPAGITRKSQDGVRANLLLTTLRSRDRIYEAQGQGIPQYDWPTPPPARQPERSWSSGALVLSTLQSRDTIYGPQGKGVPQYDWPTPPPARQPDRSWSSGSLVVSTLYGLDRVYGPPGEGIPQYDFPTPPPAYQPTRSFVAPFRLGADAKLLNQNYDYPTPPPPLPRDRFYGQTLVSLTLNSQDASTRGAPFYDLTNRGFVQPDRSYSQNIPKPLYGQPPSPFAQYDWPLPRSPIQPDRFYFSDLLFATLLHKDALINGAQFTDLAKTPAPPDRTYVQPGIKINPIPRNQFDWPVPQVPLQPDRAYSQTLNYLTLASQDATGASGGLSGSSVGPMELPRAALQPDRNYYTYPQLFSLVTPLVGPISGAPISSGPITGSPPGPIIQIPLHNVSFELPRVPLPPNRGYSQTLSSSTLLHNDRMLAGRQTSEIPQTPVQPNRSFISFVNPAVVVFPFSQVDWSVPRIALQPERSWQQNLISNTLQNRDTLIFSKQEAVMPLIPVRAVQTIMFRPSPATIPPVPFAQLDWPLPKTALQPERSWWQALVAGTLKSQDAARAVGQAGELPRSVIQPDRSYLQNTALVSYAAQIPFAQLDWPIPKVPLQPDRSWWQDLVFATLYNQDARVAGAQLIQELAKSPLQPDRSFVRVTLLPAISFPPSPFAQRDWPLPTRAVQPERFWSQALISLTLFGKDVRIISTQSAELTNIGTLQPERFWQQDLIIDTLFGQDAIITRGQLADLANGTFQPDRFYARGMDALIFQLLFPFQPPAPAPALVVTGYPAVPLWQTSSPQTWSARIGDILSKVQQGKQNVTLKITLAAGTSTVVIDPRISATSALTFTPLTADAAAILSSIYVSAQRAGRATLIYSSTAKTDCTFTLLIQG